MERLYKPYFRYLLFISLLGVLLIAASLLRITTYQPAFIFLLLAALAVASQVFTTSVSVTNKSGITFEVGTAVSIAALPIYGPMGAVLLIAASSLGLWLIKPKEKRTWKRSWKQLGFNTGMWTISIFIAGHLFLAVRSWLGESTLLGQTIPWLIAAIVDDQLNFWILAFMLRLQHKREVSLRNIWREHGWAASINIFVLSVGGGFLAFAIQQFAALGIIVFFLPIVLSAYTFRLYVRQMQTHLDGLEKVVADRTRELSNLIEEKDAFLAVLTHDMSSPLTTMSFFIDLIEMDATIVQNKPEMLDAIRGSQKMLQNIVNNILDLEKLRVPGALVLKIEPFNLSDQLIAATEIIKPQVEEKQISLQYKLDPQPLLINGDRYQIERVLLNLMSNAVKYTPLAGTININAYQSNGQVIVDIHDSGYGIPEEAISQVFERFNRFHKQKAAGTGLGLAISKALVEAHDGEISVTSIENLGSTFTVKLPCVK